MVLYGKIFIKIEKGIIMDEDNSIQNRNHILINFIWVVIGINVLFNLLTQKNLQLIDLLIIFLVHSIVTLLNKFLNRPYFMKYIVVFTSVGYMSYLTYSIPSISNYIFIIISLLIAFFYQKRKVLVLTTITAFSFQFVLLQVRGTELLLSAHIYDYINIFLFTAFIFIILLFMVNHSTTLKVKAEKQESKVKEDLHSTKSLYESLFSYSRDAIALLDANGHILEMNKAFIDLYQVPVLCEKQIQIFFSECQKDFQKALDDVQQGKSISGLELKSMKNSGEPMIVEATFSPIFNVNSSKMNAISCMIRDVTEKRLVDDYMRNSEKLKITGEIAAGVAHEIRNPLTVISGFIQMLNEQNSPNKQYFDIITSEIKRMNGIISEFLVLSKPHVSNIKLHNLQELLTEVILLFQSEAHYKDVTIKTSCNTTPFYVYCEGNQLKQVFINLLKNALEAMPEGGTVSVECGLKDDEHVQLTLIDTGIGIKEEVLLNIGKPFFTTKENGTGLGLMITERIIEQHHGSISITSQVGEGTKVEIILPFVKDQDPNTYLQSKMFD